MHGYDRRSWIGPFVRQTDGSAFAEQGTRPHAGFDDDGRSDHSRIAA